jgi:hypothetical protein
MGNELDERIPHRPHKWGEIMTGAIVIRWSATVPGREAKGLEVLTNAVGHFDELQKEGRIHGHREYFSLTGGEGGFMIVEGGVAELLAITAEDQTVKMNAQAAAVVQGFDVQVYGGGSDQAVQELVGSYVSGLQELGYL